MILGVRFQEGVITIETKSNKPNYSSKRVIEHLYDKELKMEKNNTRYDLCEGVFLERQAGTIDIYYNRDGRRVLLEDITIDDLDFFMPDSYFKNVENIDEFKIPDSLSFEDTVLSQISIESTLKAIDELNTIYCNNCPIIAKKDTDLTLVSYCSLSCPVGFELQMLGIIYETLQKRKDKDIKEVFLFSSEQLQEIRNEVKYRILKNVRSYYTRLVSPRSKASKDVN